MKTSMKSLSLERIDGGGLLTTGNDLLRELCEDAFDRPDLGKPRILTITVKVTPDPEENKVFVQSTAKSTIPETQLNRHQIVKSRGQFQIYEPPQLEFDFDAETEQPVIKEELIFTEPESIANEEKLIEKMDELADAVESKIRSIR